MAEKMGNTPNANPNASGFALQWNIGFRVVDVIQATSNISVNV